MVSSPDSEWRAAVREAVHALQGAVRTLRQHHEEPRLGQNAVRRCVTALQLASQDQAIRLHLRQGAVCHGDEELLRFAPGEVPFGPLAEAGIGDLVLARGIDPTVVEHFVATLAASLAAADCDADIAAELRNADLPGILLLAAHRDDEPREGEPSQAGLRPDWWMLPSPGESKKKLLPLVERDHDTNFPALAARLLLADLDPESGLSCPPSPHLLDGLCAAMLARGDAANTAWLLEQAQHHPAVPAEVALQLRSRAVHACHGPWLEQQLPHRERLQGLVALTMQLGDDSLQRLAAAAHGAGHPLPAWLLEFVPPPA